MFVVVVTEKGGSQQHIELDGDQVTIGRVHGNDVVLPRGNVSKRHATIDRQGHSFQLNDLGSTNGTFVNGRRVQQAQAINPGDKIYVGDFILHIEQNEASAPKIPVPKPSQNPPVPAPVSVVQEKAEKAPSIGSAIRSSAPPSVPGKREPTEKRVRVPKLQGPSEDRPITVPPPVGSAPPPPIGPGAPPLPPKRPIESSSISSPSIPIPPKRPAQSYEYINITIKQLLTDAAIQLGLSEIVDGPVALVPEKVAKLRRVIALLVREAASHDALPDGQSAAALAAEACRAAVDFGPFADWLRDPSISEIRVNGTMSLMLRRSGTLIKEENPFESHRSQREIVRRLKAGLQETGNRFFLEDGTCVTAVYGSELVLCIDKTWGLPTIYGHGPLITDIEKEPLRSAVSDHARIAVIGPRPAARRAIVQAIAQTLPNRASTAVVGELPAPLEHTFIPFSTVQAEGISGIDQAVAMGPDWLVVAGGLPRQIPRVLAAAANRPGVLAELPLGGQKPIHRELTVSLTTAGLAPSPAQAALFLSTAFDLIVITDCDEAKIPFIDSIQATGINEKGTWAPKPIFARD